MLPFPYAGDLPDPGIRPGPPTLKADCLPSELPGESLTHTHTNGNYLLSTGCVPGTYFNTHCKVFVPSQQPKERISVISLIFNITLRPREA